MGKSVSKKKKVEVRKPAIIVAIAVIIALLLLFWKSSPTNQPKTAGLKGLTFQSQEDEQRMQTLNTCIADFREQGWQHHEDFSEHGNFYQSTWCNGSGCTNANRKKHTITLFTTLYKLPQVYGVGLDAALVPESPGWGVNFSFADGLASSVTNNRLHINFMKYDGSGAGAEKVYVGSGNSYKIYETELAIDSASTLKEDVVRYTSTAQNMRDNALTQLKALRNKVLSALSSRGIERCEYTPSKTQGLPPVCVRKRALTESEKSDERKKASEYFDTQERLITSEYQNMYDVLVKAVPLANCLY